MREINSAIPPIRMAAKYEIYYEGIRVGISPEINLCEILLADPPGSMTRLHAMFYERVGVGILQ